MSGSPTTCGVCGSGPCGGRGKTVLKEGVWSGNPISVQMLGVCSALAVTVRVANAVAMGLALVFVLIGSSLVISLLRSSTPRRIRLIAEMAVIATFVILVDEFLRAYYFSMSRELGPYVGLIITNCIVLGRAEAFALQNRPLISMLDGVANGIGYALVLILVAGVREVLGNGSFLDVPLLPEAYLPNLVFVMAPGAFIVLGFLIALFNGVNGPTEEEAAT